MIMEFHDGIVDTLYSPTLAIKGEASGVVFRNKMGYTKVYPVEINGEQFEVQYIVSFDNLFMKTGKMPDYRNSVHPVMRFVFPVEQSVEGFDLYYNCGMQLSQFCNR